MKENIVHHAITLTITPGLGNKSPRKKTSNFW